MENTFSQRLKALRQRRGLTQQELADRLGVSNKSVSRWESGGYPDVPLLVPLARALGVTVDELLDEVQPVRALGRTDWQSLLSFAFALGGGLLFFLLDLFVPLPVCYAVYLGCMAYGVYLQRYYAYRSRWFLLGNLAMDLSVNLSLCGKAATVLWAVWTSFSLWSLPPGQAPDTSLSQSFGYIAAPILLALAVTAFTQYLLYRWSGLDASLPRLRLCLRRPGWPALLGLVPLLACLFWALFPTLCRACSALFPVQEEHIHDLLRGQEHLYIGLLLLLAVLGSLPLLIRKRWPRLPFYWLLCLLCLPMEGLRTYSLAWSPVSQDFIPYQEGLAPSYVPVGQPSWAMLLLALVLAAGWALFCSLSLRSAPREPSCPSEGREPPSSPPEP